ncbi:PepSY domain-containing protein [Actinomadura fibrosa]|uniref:PepSY domain-containing protein n=1 Tax=Actinomadura fibrosa TaxID=111802 RepID=A0ABW2XJA8_9ACTN|nr:PepSY domain-containing protein [Actinomadura fibrosa]
MRLIAAALAASLALTACTSGQRDRNVSPDAPDTTASSGNAVGSSATPGSGFPTASGLLERAGETARKAVPGSTLTAIESNQNGWSANLVGSDGTERVLTLSPDGGQVTGNQAKSQDASGKSENQAAVKAAKLDYRAAAQRMRTAAPNTWITELNLDEKGGTTVWEGDLRGAGDSKHPVTIDAANGKVIKS